MRTHVGQHIRAELRVEVAVGHADRRRDDDADAEHDEHADEHGRVLRNEPVVDEELEGERPEGVEGDVAEHTQRNEHLRLAVRPEVGREPAQRVDRGADIRRFLFDLVVHFDDRWVAGGLSYAHALPFPQLTPTA